MCEETPWFGASPDGLVYDPLERPTCGLVEIKCPNAQSYVDCGYLTVHQGQRKLRESHAYYWQVQGQLLVTGMVWCDFVVCANNDVCSAYIYINEEVLSKLKQKCDLFFFSLNVYI